MICIYNNVKKPSLLHVFFLPEASNPNVSHFSRVGNQVQAFIHLSVDNGERTVL